MNVSGKIYKLERNAIWLLVFHHDVTIGEFFVSQEEGKKCFNYTGGKYSILYSLNNEYRINGKFEFLLEYPEKNKSNQWRQSNNPLRQSMIYNKNVTGYQPIDIQMSQAAWGGLYVKPAGSSTLIAGSINGLWHYSIGTINKEYYPCFPGPGTDSKIVSLWVRVRGEPNKCTLRGKTNAIPKLSIFVCFSLCVS